MKSAIRIEGKKFGRLTVISRSENIKKQPAWNCICECGVHKVIRGGVLKSGNTKSCGCLNNERIAAVGRSHSGENHPQWKGGRYKDSGGYIRISAKGNYPSGARIKIAEHTVVMEKFLGRKLFKGETVHHKNGIRHDNRIENLELKASNHGAGQSIPDLLAWAKEIILRYDTK